MLPKDPYTNPAVVNPDVKMTGVQYENNPEAAYGEHIRDTSAICNTSASHTYGNVLSVIENHLTDVFSPQVDFKTVMASTTLASRQVRHLPHQLQKKELPMMVLVPRIVFGQDDNRFLGHTLINDRYTNTHSLWGEGSLLELASDRRKHMWVHGHYNRALMYVDVVLCFNTYSEFINCQSYIHNVLCVNHNKFIRAPLELYIPEECCELISNLVKVPMNTKEGSVQDFLTYMNSVWHFPITYKLKGGSNTNEFFMYYLADIDMEIQDVSPGQGIKDGQIRRNFDITFTVRCEFNTIGYFNISSPQITRRVRIPIQDDGKVLPMFTDSINLDDFVLPVGWSILCWPIFKLKYGQCSVSLNPILNDSLNAVIDYHLRFNIPMNRFINIQFRENGQILNEEMFYIDWGKRELIVSNPNIRRTYRLIVMVSVEYVNNLVKDLYGLE